MGVSMVPSSLTWVDPGQLAEGVADEHRAGDLVLKQVAAVRQDGGHAGADLVTADHGRVTDADTRDVGNRVVRTGGVDADDDAEIARARARLGEQRRGPGSDRAHEHNAAEHPEHAGIMTRWAGMGHVLLMTLSVVVMSHGL
jgi:hypothetical protein